MPTGISKKTGLPSALGIKHPHTLKEIQKIKEAWNNAEYRENQIRKKTGRTLSETTKQKMSKSHLGKNNWSKGRKLSEETRKKISEASKGRIFSAESRIKMSERQKKEKHYNWKGGISNNPYPKEFNSKLKLKIRQRDNFTCCLCSKTEREELEELNRVLCVNHIDFNKNNINQNNLNTLCLRCNIKINREREYWTNYFNNSYEQ